MSICAPICNSSHEWYEMRKTTLMLLSNALLLSYPLLSIVQSSSIAARARVILQANCLSCQGATKISGLDLGQQDSDLKGGKHGSGFVPGDPDGSLLYKTAIQAGDLKMPMLRPRLAEAKLKTLREGIKEGAPWDTNQA